MTEIASKTFPTGEGVADPADLESTLEQHRKELTAYAYRMLASSFEAEDAVQETMIRAWRSYESFEGRSALRSWLYRITTNVCLDMLNGRERRARPMDLGPSGEANGPLGGTLPEVTWIEPVPDDKVMPLTADPAELAVARESVNLAFVAALQYLPPRQRAVLILREVLRWRATEVAELLDTSVASVNSALQRARVTLAESGAATDRPSEPMDAEQQALLERYVKAFEAYDMESLTSLLHEDATQSMPPFELWLTGRENIFDFWLGHGAGCRGSHLIPVQTANGSPAFGQYKPSGPGGKLEPWSLQVLEIVDGRIAEFTFFLDTARMFPLFGLPLNLDEQPA
jgi:RNA polymerase sigma-70 factor (ECF subfamily)